MDTQTLSNLNVSPANPGTAGIEVSTECRSARSDQLRGGDMVDVYNEGDGSAWVLLADMSSKGTRSIEHVELLRAAFRRAARSERSPSSVMAALNRLRFAATVDHPEAFATVFVARFGRARRSLCYASGGHDTALVFRGRTHRHLAQTGPVIGVIPNASYRDCSVKFDSEDILVIATDGFTECRRDRAPFDELGTSGIVRALHAEPVRSPQGACALVCAFADAFTGGSYRDDATLVAVSRL